VPEDIVRKNLEYLFEQGIGINFKPFQTEGMVYSQEIQVGYGQKEYMADILPSCRFKPEVLVTLGEF
jgi:hypothetical protein